MPGVVVSAGGGAVAIIGAGLIANAISKRKDVEDTRSLLWSDVENDADAVRRRSGAGIALLAIGAAALAAGVVIILIARSSSSEVSVNIGPGNLGLSGRF